MNYEEMNSKYYPMISEVIKSIYDKRMKNANHRILRDYYSELCKYILSLKNRIYSILSIAAYNAFNEKEDDRIIIPSVGIEFLQNSRLIHDDLIQKNNSHDSEPSFHYRFHSYHSKYNLQKMTYEDFGSNLGLLGGNSSGYIGLEAFTVNDFKLDLNLKAIEYYEILSHQIGESMLIEIDVLNNQYYDLSDYIKIISLKTGALVEKSLLMGANYANIKEKQLKILSEFGINLGILFQIIRDFSIIFEEKSSINLLLDNYIRETRVPLYLFKGYDKLRDNQISKLRNIIETKNSEGNISREIIILLQNTGIIESCEELMIHYHKKVENTFAKVRPLINKSGLELFDDLMNTYIEPIFDIKL